MTGALLGILVKTVACGGIGYGMRRRGAFDAGMADGFTALLLFIITPCVVLTTATSSHSPDLGGEILVGILIASLFLVCAMGLLQLVSRWLPLSVAHQRAFVNLCCLPNVGFIGIPITYELFGSPGVMVALVVNLVYNVISFTWGAWNFAGTARVRDLLANPSATISLLGLGLFFLNVRLPSVISSCLEMIGGTMTPVALFVVGISLAESRFGELVRNWWGYGVAGVRLLVLPLGLFGVLRVVGVGVGVGVGGAGGVGGGVWAGGGVTGALAASVCCVLFAMPSGTFNVMLAKRARSPVYDFAVHGVVQTNILMFATLPLVILITQ